jgi:hypothetical protein
MEKTEEDITDCRMTGLWYGEGLRNNLRFDVDILCVLSANIISQ